MSSAQQNQASEPAASTPLGEFTPVQDVFFLFHQAAEAGLINAAYQFEADNPGSLERIADFYDAVFAKAWSDADALFREQYEKEHGYPYEGELSQSELEFFLKEQGLFDEVFEQAFDDVFNETFDEVEDQELIEFMKWLEDAQNGLQLFEDRFFEMRDELFFEIGEDGQLVFIPPDAETLAQFEQLLKELIDFSIEHFGENVFDELTDGQDPFEYLQKQMELLEKCYAEGQDVSDLEAAATSDDAIFDFAAIDAESLGPGPTDGTDLLLARTGQDDSNLAGLLETAFASQKSSLAPTEAEQEPLAPTHTDDTIF